VAGCRIDGATKDELVAIIAELIPKDRFFPRMAAIEEEETKPSPMPRDELRKHCEQAVLKRAGKQLCGAEQRIYDEHMTVLELLKATEPRTSTLRYKEHDHLDVWVWLSAVANTRAVEDDLAGAFLASKAATAVLELHSYIEGRKKMKERG